LIQKPAALEAKVLEVAAERGIWLFNHVMASAIPGHAMGEIQIGDAVEQLSTDEIAALFRRILA
jgi:hypothetical protein